MSRIQEAITEYIAEEVSQQFDDYDPDFSQEIKDAIYDYDFSDDIQDAVENYDFSLEVGNAVAHYMENSDLDALKNGIEEMVRKAIGKILSKKGFNDDLKLIMHEVVRAELLRMQDIQCSVMRERYGFPDTDADTTSDYDGSEPRPEWLNNMTGSNKLELINIHEVRYKDIRDGSAESDIIYVDLDKLCDVINGQSIRDAISELILSDRVPFNANHMIYPNQNPNDIQEWLKECRLEWNPGDLPRTHRIAKKKISDYESQDKVYKEYDLAYSRKTRD